MSGWQIFVEVPGRPPVEVRTGESIVGRSRTAQVHVPDSTVSRQHARLIAGGLGDVQVEDLGSSNGTYVNGDRIEGRRRLVDGDRILIGDAELRVRIVAPVATSEATVRLTLPPLGGPPPVQPMASPPPPSPSAAPPSMPLMPPPTPAPPPAALRAAAPPPLPAMPPQQPQAGSAASPPRPAPPPLEPLPPRGTPPPNVASTVLAPPAPRWTPPPPSPTWSSAEARAAAPAPPPAPPAAKPLPAGPSPRAEVLPSFADIESRLPPRIAPASAAAPVTRPAPTLAGFGIRLLAWLIDFAILAVAALGIYAFAFVVVPLQAAGRSLLATAAVLAVELFYPLVFWATKGATPGKMMLGLSIVGRSGEPGEGIGWGTAILRLVGYMLSGAIAGVGFLLILFTSQKQGLHDLIAGTRVLRTR